MNNANQSSIALSLSLAVALGIVSVDAFALKTEEIMLPANGLWSCDVLDNFEPTGDSTLGGSGTPSEECRDAPQDILDLNADGTLDKFE